MKYARRVIADIKSRPWDSQRNTSPPTGHHWEWPVSHCSLFWLCLCISVIKAHRLIPHWLPCWSAHCRARAWMQRLASVVAQREQSWPGRCWYEKSGGLCRQSCKQSRGGTRCWQCFGGKATGPQHSQLFKLKCYFLTGFLQVQQMKCE